MAIWGIADPLPLPIVYGTVGGADVTTTPTEDTPVITTGELAGLSPGPYYPLIMGVLTIVLGGTAPASLQIDFFIGDGSDVDTYLVEPGLLVASAELVIPVYLLGVNAYTPWAGAGSVINVGVTTPDEAVTVKNVGSRCIIGLQRGPDL
jgi:hypothetical protein